MSGTERIELSVFGKSSSIHEFPVCDIWIHTRSGPNVKISVLVCPSIANGLPNYDRKKLLEMYDYMNGVELADQCTGNTYDVDVLIGADYFWSFVGNETVRGQSGDPVCVDTKFGFIPSGPCKLRNRNNSIDINVIMDNISAEFSVDRYWNLESLGLEHKDDNFNFDSYCTDHIHFVHNHYEVDLPWNNYKDCLPTNYNTCVKQTRAMILRLSADKRFAYDRIIKEQLNRGFIESVSDPHPTSGHYLCHYAVDKLSSTTTPLRIVYRCNFKIGSNPSLNDCLHPGVPSTQDLGGIIMRFRLFEQVASADIEKAFLNITISAQDRPYVKWLWLSDPTDPQSPLQEFQFRSVLFGATCSPFLLNAVIKVHLDSWSNCALVDQYLRHDLYVDNLISSIPSGYAMDEFYHQNNEIFQKAGFCLRSWTSNNQTVQRLAANDGRGSSPSDCVNILGMLWNKDADTMNCKTLPPLDATRPITPRNVLRETARLFDVPGLLLPVHVKAKIFLQDLQIAKASDKGPLSDILAKQWLSIHADLRKATAEVNWHRLVVPNLTPTTPVELHVFADASKRSYGAALYIVANGHSSILWARNKLVHTNELSNPRIPRNELNSCVLATLVLDYVQKHLAQRLNIVNSTLWSDSQIVLWWLHSDKVSDRYVENRRLKIKQANLQRIRYCTSHENPADLLTRGISTDKLLDSPLWWNGPSFLITKSYPVLTGGPPSPNANPTAVVQANALILRPIQEETPFRAETNVTTLIDETRYSSLRKLFKVSVFVMRFVNGVRGRPRPDIRSPTSIELNEVRRLWCIKIQSVHFQDHQWTVGSRKKTCLAKQLKLFLDHGVLRKGSRMEYADIPSDSKYPILLPADCHFTTLVVRDAHSRTFHAGPNTTNSALMQVYHIPNMGATVKRILRKCVTCNKINSRAYRMPTTPPLPKFRVDLSAQPFQATGVDYTGEVSVKIQNGALAKVYIVLFTCATTRGVHLDYVEDLSAVQFLSCFQRFMARKSTPQLLVSDNASYFQSSSKQLQELARQSSVSEYLAEFNINWKFIPQRAPWWGAFWERMIGVTKRMLQKVVGRQLLTSQELYTTLTQIEAGINDRPLTSATVTTGNDPCPITPSHLIYGRRLTSIPVYNPENEDDYKPTTLTADIARKRLGQLTKLFDQFWTKFQKEYFLVLRDRHVLPSQAYEGSKIKPGCIVLVHEDVIKRPIWKMALVTKLLPSRDGLPRAAQIKTQNGITNRPVNKLFPLELSASTKELFTTPEKTLDNKTQNENETLDVPKLRPKRAAAEAARDRIRGQLNVEVEQDYDED